MQVKILDKRITPEMLKPETEHSAGIDLHACIDKEILIPPQKAILIPTGVAMWINHSRMVGMIYPRSGAGHKRGLILGNGTGVIDPDYQGEWLVSAYNRNPDKYISIAPMERIAQAVFVPFLRPEIQIVGNFSNESERGTGGFGSTGA